MASGKEFLLYALDQLSELDNLTWRPMMNEYILYHRGKVIGGIYDDRLLLKPTPSAIRILQENGYGVQYELPYEGAKEMLAPDTDNRELLSEIVNVISDELPEPRKKHK